MEKRKRYKYPISLFIYFYIRLKSVWSTHFEQYIYNYWSAAIRWVSRRGGAYLYYRLTIITDYSHTNALWQAVMYFMGVLAKKIEREPNDLINLTVSLCLHVGIYTRYIHKLTHALYIYVREIAGLNGKIKTGRMCIDVKYIGTRSIHSA